MMLSCIACTASAFSASPFMRTNPPSLRMIGGWPTRKWRSDPPSLTSMVRRASNAALAPPPARRPAARAVEAAAFGRAASVEAASTRVITRSGSGSSALRLTFTAPAGAEYPNSIECPPATLPASSFGAISLTRASSWGPVTGLAVMVISPSAPRNPTG